MKILQLYDYFINLKKNYNVVILKKEINNRQRNYLINELLKDNVFNNKYCNLKTIIGKINDLKFCYYLEFKIYNLTFKLQFILLNKDLTILKIILFICFMLTNYFKDKGYFKNNYYSSVYVVFYLYDHPRTLNGNSFDDLRIKNNFNCPSGYTYKNKIIITRLQGYCGLFIHELLHFFKDDGLNIDNYKNYEEEYQKLFNYYISDKTKPGYLFEGINNFKTIIFFVLFKSSFYDYTSIEMFKELFKEYVKSFLLCYKIIKFYNCLTFEDLIKKKLYIQYGSTFEYSFVRFYIFYLYARKIIEDEVEIKEETLQIIMSNLNNLFTKKVNNLNLKLLKFNNRDYKRYKKIFKIDDKDVEYYDEF